MTSPPSTPANHVSARARRGRWRRLAAGGLALAAVVVLIAGVQAAGFYAVFAPRLAAGNERLQALHAEVMDRTLFRRVTSGMRPLLGSTAPPSGLADDWRSFEALFAVDPAKAVRELRGALGKIDDPELSPDLLAALERLQAMYADPYEPLLDALEAPPIYLRPTADALAEISGYRRTVALDRVLHLALVGEIGTAHVVLTGVHASTSDPRVLGKVYYLLGRLQFEAFRLRPRPEYHLRSVEYTRRSLRSEPDSELARRFLDYLLSLDIRASTLKTLPGAPASRSDAEGAPVPEGERRF